jgi:dihydroneopterin aldolase
MLASVSSLEEARLVRDFNADIIDLKQPALGALGALAPESVREIVLALGPGVRISATIGDIPMQRELVCRAVAAMAATGVDYIKIGFFPDGDSLDCIEGLADYARRGHALIAVLFADCEPDFRLLPRLSAAGFRGAMLDTRDKQLGSMPKLLNNKALQTFVQTAKQQGLLTGLAGSLTVADIAELLPLNADYLGFRGALCRQGCRTAEIDPEQVKLIRSLLKGFA